MTLVHYYGRVFWLQKGIISKVCLLRMFLSIKWFFSYTSLLKMPFVKKWSGSKNIIKNIKVWVDYQMLKCKVPENHQEKYLLPNLYSLKRKWKISFILGDTVYTVHCCFRQPGEGIQIEPNWDLSKALNNRYRLLLLRI